MARLTIGIPCYNEAAHIAQCIRSVLSQDCSADSLRVIVSDNASQDATLNEIEAVLASFPAERQATVTVLKQTVNAGATTNFWTVHDACETEYFMWLGAHDYLTPDFVSVTLPRIDGDKGISMATGQPLSIVDSETKERVISDARYDFSDPNPLVRYFRSVAELKNCTVFHSIFRHGALEGISRESILPIDHVIISHLLARGSLAYTRAGYVRRYFREKAPRPYPFYDLAFFNAYLTDFEICFTDRLPEAVLQAARAALFTQLVNRFGMPPLVAAMSSKAA